MTYFEREVNMDRIFGSAVNHTTLTMPTVHNAKQWIDRIENALSPENLSCDGELPRGQVLAKRKELEAAYRFCSDLLWNHCATHTEPVRGYADQFTVRALYNKAKRERTQQRETKLIAAVNDGFKVGARILISNGTTGVIVKINRTRVKVKGDDNRMWSVPPRCMSLLKVR